MQKRLESCENILYYLYYYQNFEVIMDTNGQHEDVAMDTYQSVNHVRDVCSSREESCPVRVK